MFNLKTTVRHDRKEDIFYGCITDIRPDLYFAFPKSSLQKIVAGTQYPKAEILYSTLRTVPEKEFVYDCRLLSRSSSTSFLATEDAQDCLSLRLRHYQWIGNQLYKYGLSVHSKVTRELIMSLEPMGSNKYLIVSCK